MPAVGGAARGARGLAAIARTYRLRRGARELHQPPHRRRHRQGARHGGGHPAGAGVVAGARRRVAAVAAGRGATSPPSTRCAASITSRCSSCGAAGEVEAAGATTLVPSARVAEHAAELDAHRGRSGTTWALRRAARPRRDAPRRTARRHARGRSRALGAGLRAAGGGAGEVGGGARPAARRRVTAPPQATLVVRRCRAADIERISDIERASFSDPWSFETFSAALALRHLRFLVAEEIPDGPGGGGAAAARLRRGAGDGGRGGDRGSRGRRPTHGGAASRACSWSA